MKAVQIEKYSKKISVNINNIKKPTPKPDEILIKVHYAAINPLDIMNIRGSVKLIQNYKMPLTLGNEISGEVVEIGKKVKKFKTGDNVYSRLPLDKIGGFAEYVSVKAEAVWYIPNNLTLKQAVAIPLTGLTAFQGLTEELQVEPNKTLFIPGGSGSFGQIAVPIAKSMGLRVIVSGNERARIHIMRLGADQYINYKTTNYWEVLRNIDYVIDTRGIEDVEKESSIMRNGGRILSLIAGPNKYFATVRNYPIWKQVLFGLVGRKLDKITHKYGVDYRFIFVRSNGEQLKEVTKIVEKNNIVPVIDEHEFDIDHIEDALKLVDQGNIHGKVVVSI